MRQFCDSVFHHHFLYYLLWGQNYSPSGGWTIGVENHCCQVSEWLEKDWNRGLEAFPTARSWAGSHLHFRLMPKEEGQQYCCYHILGLQGKEHVWAEGRGRAFHIPLKGISDSAFPEAFRLQIALTLCYVWVDAEGSITHAELCVCVSVFLCDSGQLSLVFMKGWCRSLSFCLLQISYLSSQERMNTLSYKKYFQMCGWKAVQELDVIIVVSRWAHFKYAKIKKQHGYSFTSLTQISGFVSVIWWLNRQVLCWRC